MSKIYFLVHFGNNNENIYDNITSIENLDSMNSSVFRKFRSYQSDLVRYLTAGCAVSLCTLYCVVTSVALGTAGAEAAAALKLRQNLTLAP